MSVLPKAVEPFPTAKVVLEIIPPLTIMTLPVARPLPINPWLPYMFQTVPANTVRVLLDDPFPTFNPPLNSVAFVTVIELKPTPAALRVMVELDTMLAAPSPPTL